MGPSTDRELQAGVRLVVINGALGHQSICVYKHTHIHTHIASHSEYQIKGGLDRQPKTSVHVACSSSLASTSCVLTCL